MSNSELSKLYETVIEDVINDSRQDFENSGIDETTLQELRRIWCEKLTNSGVAPFSWDNNHLKDEEDEEEEEIEPMPVPEVSTGLELPDIGIEIPQIKTENNVNNDHGLMLPRLNQTDGTFELNVFSSDAKQVMNNIKSKEMKNKLKQVDGTLNDEDDDDDDADLFNDSDDINSDLDDIESEKSDEEDGDQEGQIMLCLYDKVQRIKNKWKSSLKEGIANINQKDYVFHKATGECEW